jgi:hypothetical protein
LDEVQGQILASNLGDEQNTVAAPGYLSWLDGLGFSRDPEEYPVIDITDDGIGDGSRTPATRPCTGRIAGTPLA